MVKPRRVWYVLVVGVVVILSLVVAAVLPPTPTNAHGGRSDAGDSLVTGRVVRH